MHAFGGKSSFEVDVGMDVVLTVVKVNRKLNKTSEKP
jgi:hypothetical protein